MKKQVQWAHDIPGDPPEKWHIFPLPASKTALCGWTVTGLTRADVDQETGRDVCSDCIFHYIRDP